MPIGSTLEKKMHYRIMRAKASVFILSDFYDLSDVDQIGRILRKFVKDRVVIKIGQGIYAKARISSVTNNLIPEKDLRSLALEVLDKLNIKVSKTNYEELYMKEKSTQLSTGRVIAVRSRISRKIGFNGNYIQFSRVAA